MNLVGIIVGGINKVKLGKHILVIWFIMCLLVSFPNFTNNVGGIVIGSFYVCNLEDQAIGTLWINESIAGVKWLGIEPSNKNGAGVQTSADPTFGSTKFYQITMINQGTICDVWFNLSRNTDYIQYDTFGASSNAATWSLNHYFRRSNGDQICRVLVQDNNAGGLDYDWYVS